ncbi:MAG TPA: YbhB/YbcL family Raf kinase inhibitor-like protein [Rhizomicrobium sp.]|nr:YbhB/YbcL family Raf kinase inhibitor-like protein [Rhizomicrobium sp.]
MRFSHLVLAPVLSLAATPCLAMDLQSTDVMRGASFPVSEICSRYGGRDISPALTWSDVPAQARSLAVTIFDPDAHGGWWHWLVLDVPTSATALPQGAGGRHEDLPAGARQHGNSDGNERYDGPCPPAGSGVHHYEITLWALDVPQADVDVNAEPGEVGGYLAKHAIAKAQLTPVYQK